MVAGAALGQLLESGPVMQMADDIGFPIGGAVARIGRVDHRRLVREIREILLQQIEHFDRRKSGYGFRHEPVFDLRREERRDVRGRVVLHRCRRADDHVGVVNSFLERLLLQKAIRNDAGRDKPDRKDEQEHEVEFDAERKLEFHGVS
jgi:hypothetical protein